MIYLTGDTHGNFYRILDFCEEMNTTKEDIMIILGDAGINYYLNKRDEHLKEFIDLMPTTLFCIHGNHEQRPYAIETYKESKWHGGTVYIEEAHPSIIFAKDGEVYDFNGKKAIVIGGAYSIDKFYRLMRGYAWFENEQPSEEIKKCVEEKLDEINWSVDYVFSHTVPIKYEPIEVFLPRIDQSKVDKSTEIWLGKLEEKLQYQKWYCGHYHTKKVVDRIQLLFENYEMFD